MRPDPVATLDARVLALQRGFEQVQATRMQGLPLLNPALWVEAVEFEPLLPVAEAAEPDTALGVLITPWFMNLLLLPLHPQALSGLRTGHSAGLAAGDLWHVGEPRAQAVGPERFEFIGAHEPAIGAYAACSLFSPMFEFRSQSAARATAQAVLAALRFEPGPSSMVRPAAPPPPAVPARRAFLLGRSTA